MITANVIQAPAGLAKTSEVVQWVAHHQGGPVEIYVPTHALAADLERAIRAVNPNQTVRVIAGRSHSGANGKPLCRENKMAEAIAKAGGEVYPSLCSRKKGKKLEQCRHYGTCPYINQFAPARVTIYTHAHLPLPRMRLEGGVPEVAVIDESFFQSCIEILEVPLTLLRPPFAGTACQQVLPAIEHALVHGLPLLKHLRDAGLDWEKQWEARQELTGRRRAITPGMSQTAQRSMLAGLARRTQLRKLLDALAREAFAHRGQSHALSYDPVTQMITVHLKKSIRRFEDYQRNVARVLVIDANADEELIGQFLRVGTFARIRASRQARVIQCRSTRCSTTSLDPSRNADPTSRREAKQRLKEVGTMIARLAAQHSKVLVVGPQAIVGNPKDKAKPLLKVPINVDLAHFNSIRGIDKWKHHDAVVVIGRNGPPIKAVEAIARCVYLSDRKPLHFADDWIAEARGYRVKRERLGVDVVRHRDARAQTVLEQVREAETLQAIDRLRLVHAPAPKHVYVLSNIPLDIDVDELVTWDEIVNGSRLEQAWNTLPGVIPLVPAWLARKFPKQWGTSDAAKADVRRELKGAKECQFSNSISIRNLTLFKHRYRPRGASGAGRKQRAWSVCLSRDASTKPTRAALEALLGARVVMARDFALRVARGPAHRASRPMSRSPCSTNSGPRTGRSTNLTFRGGTKT